MGGNPSTISSLQPTNRFQFFPRPLKRTPLVDQAIAVIEAAILRKKLPLGFRLKEEELDRSLGISRSPLREAIQRLIAVCLLRAVPPRGVFVAQIRRKKVSELMAVREVLEALAAQLAANSHHNKRIIVIPA